MIELVLKRIVAASDAMLGVLIIEGKPRLVTLERPWQNNEREKSCIPIGRYKIARIQSPKFGETFEVRNVPKRDAILFHAGNTSDDTKGCIIVANRYGVTFGRSRVMESKDGFEWFLRYLTNCDEAQLTVEEHV